MEAVIHIMETLLIDKHYHRTGRDDKVLLFSSNSVVWGYCRMTHRFKK